VDGCGIYLPAVYAHEQNCENQNAATIFAAARFLGPMGSDRPGARSLFSPRSRGRRNATTRPGRSLRHLLEVVAGLEQRGVVAGMVAEVLGKDPEA